MNILSKKTVDDLKENRLLRWKLNIMRKPLFHWISVQ